MAAIAMVQHLSQHIKAGKERGSISFDFDRAGLSPVAIRNFTDPGIAEKAKSQPVSLVLSSRGDSYANAARLIVTNQPGLSSEERANFAESVETIVSDFETSAINFQDKKLLTQHFAETMGKLTAVIAEVIGEKPKAARKALISAEVMAMWERPREDATTVTGHTDEENGERYYIAQIDESISDLTYAQMNEYFRIFDKSAEHPAWFQAMPGWQQAHLKERIKDVYSQYSADNDEQAARVGLNEALTTIPTAMRGVPGLANHTRHSMIMYDDKGNVLRHTSSSNRASIFYPIGLEGNVRQQDGNRLAMLNLEQAIQPDTIANALANYKAQWGEPKPNETIKLPINLQTLISPFRFESMKPEECATIIRAKMDFIKENNGREFELNGQKVELALFGTNHPLNSLRMVPVIIDKNAMFSKPQVEAFERFTRDFVAQGKDKWPKGNEKREQLKTLAKLCNEYHKTANDYDTTGNHRQLFLASLEEMMAEAMGGLTIGGCKSAKDRRGVELLHTDAMHAYQQRYEKLPSYVDKPGSEERQRFVNIMADLFVSNHQQYCSDQNASGCYGLKSVTDVLPDDVQKAVKQRNPDVFKENKFNASLNAPPTKLTGKSFRLANAQLFDKFSEVPPQDQPTSEKSTVVVAEGKNNKAITRQEKAKSTNVGKKALSLLQPGKKAGITMLVGVGLMGLAVFAPPLAAVGAVVLTAGLVMGAANIYQNIKHEMSVSKLTVDVAPELNTAIEYMAEHGNKFHSQQAQQSTEYNEETGSVREFESNSSTSSRSMVNTALNSRIEMIQELQGEHNTENSETPIALNESITSTPGG